jgi:hemolysin-activating ACP:hemolysin acyltransferase
MIQKACGKLEFMSNNCSAKRCIFSSYCTGNMIQKACGKLEFMSKNCCLFYHIIVQALSRQFLKKFKKKQFLKHLTIRIKNFV